MIQTCRFSHIQAVCKWFLPQWEKNTLALNELDMEKETRIKYYEKP